MWKHYNYTIKTSSKQIPGWPRNIRTEKLVKAIQKQVKQNSWRSMRKTAKDLKISKSILKVFLDALELTEYKKVIQVVLIGSIQENDNLIGANFCSRKSREPQTLFSSAPNERYWRRRLFLIDRMIAVLFMMLNTYWKAAKIICAVINQLE